MNDLVENDDIEIEDYIEIIEKLLDIINDAGSDIIEGIDEYESAYIRACRMVGIAPTLIEEEFTSENLYEE